MQRLRGLGDAPTVRRDFVRFLRRPNLPHMSQKLSPKGAGSDLAGGDAPHSRIPTTPIIRPVLPFSARKENSKSR